MERRDAQGVLQPSASKLPSGMKALADYVHRSAACVLSASSPASITLWCDYVHRVLSVK
jgi:hypothetical protein